MNCSQSLLHIKRLHCTEALGLLNYCASPLLKVPFVAAGRRQSAPTSLYFLVPVYAQLFKVLFVLSARASGTKACCACWLVRDRVVMQDFKWLLFSQRYCIFHDAFAICDCLKYFRLKLRWAFPQLGSERILLTDCHLYFASFILRLSRECDQARKKLKWAARAHP
jgi:hypothetical protein